MSGRLNSAHRLVIKIGSSLLVAPGDGVRRDWLDALAEDVAAQRKAGREVIIVTSGAIAIGRSTLGLSGRPDSLSEAQAAACIGQISLIDAYCSALAKQEIRAGQLLLTVSDIDGRRTYLNARETIEAMLKLGVVPIVNENDATATEEIRVGDNDRLAARVAQMAGADLLLLLSDVDGLYTANPAHNSEAEHLKEVPHIDAQTLALAGEAEQLGVGKGGMRTKLLAGQIATEAGCAMVIMNGHALRPLQRLDQGERHSFFPATGRKLDARKLWLSGQLGTQGDVQVDSGAVQALKSGKSLLAAGIVSVSGDFGRGDAVTVSSPEGRICAKGLTSYDSEELTQIKGLKSRDIEGQLGYTRSQTVIHRDNMVLAEDSET